MAYNGSGTHVRVHDWTTDLANTVPVTASRMDAEHDDISTALSNAICRDGQSTTTARIPFASGLSAAAGAISAAAYAQTNDTNTGLYFPAADSWGLTAGGTGTLTSTATLISAAVNLAPATSDGAALGTTALPWSDIHIATGGVINWANGGITITESTDSLVFQAAANGYLFDAKVAPATSDGAALGSTSLMWSDIFMASGAVINFNNSDVAITHTANTLAFSGASTGYTFDSTISAANITASGTVTVPNDSFTYAKLQNVSAADRILGSVAGGDIEEITCTAAGRALIDDASAAAQRTTLGLGTSSTFNVGTSGGTLPRLDTSNTFSAGTTQTFAAIVASGTITTTAAGGVVAKNAVKAFGTVVNSALVTGSFNISGLVDNGTTHTLSFTSGMSGTAYTVLLSLDRENADSSMILSYLSRGTTGFTVAGRVGGSDADPDSYSFMVLENA